MNYKHNSSIFLFQLFFPKELFSYGITKQGGFMRKLILFLNLIRIQIDTSTILKFSGYYNIELYVIYHNLIGFTYKLFSH